jgi:hypothetical protein
VTVRPRRVLVPAVAALLALTSCTGGPTGGPASPSTAAGGPGPRVATGTTLYVSQAVDGGGDGTKQHPFGSIMAAVRRAGPGTTVDVGAGRYHERLTSVRSGAPGAPIRWLGHDAVLVGRGNERLVQITHDDITLEGFEITGGNKLVWLFGASRVRLLDNWLHDAGGECVRVRYHADDNEIARNRIERCGRRSFDLERHSKNGEGVYLGTAPEQLDENPTTEPDTSSGNWVHDNTFDVPAECVDVKEDAHDNVVERNACAGGLDPEGAGFSTRGLGTVLRENTASGEAGSGIRMGGDRSGDGVQSVVEHNTVDDNGEFGIEINAEPQRRVCGNVTRGNRLGATNHGDIDVAESCRS